MSGRKSTVASSAGVPRTARSGAKVAHFLLHRDDVVGELVRARPGDGVRAILKDRTLSFLDGLEDPDGALFGFAHYEVGFFAQLTSSLGSAPPRPDAGNPRSPCP